MFCVSFRCTTSWRVMAFRLVLAGLAIASLCGVGGLATIHADQAIPPTDTGIIDLEIPKGATATVSGREYSASRALEFKPFAPGASAKYDFTVRLSNGRSVMRSVLLMGGRRVRLAVTDEPAGARPELVLQTGHTNRIAAIAYSPDGTRFLTGGDDSQAILWDVSTGRVLRTFEGPAAGKYSSGVFSVKFFPDNRRIMTAASKGAITEITVWDTADGKKLTSIQSPYVPRVLLSDDGRRILAGHQEGAIVSLYDAQTGQKLKSHRVTNSTSESPFINDLAFHPAGSQILTAGMPGEDNAVLWDADSGRRIQTFSPGSEVESVTFTPDGKRVLTMGGEAILWDAATAKEIARFPVFAGWAAFSPDGNRVLLRIGNGNWAELWDVPTKTKIHSDFQPNELNAAVFSSDGKQILAAFGDDIDEPTAEDPPLAVVFEADTGKSLHTFEGLPNWQVEEVRFSPSGDQFMTGLNHRFAYKSTYLLRKDPEKHSTSAAVVWNQRSGQPLHVLRQPNYIFRSAVYDWQGGKLAIRGHGIHPDFPVTHDLLIWDAVTGQKLKSYSTLDGVRLSGFSKDGSRLVGVDTGTYDSGTYWWDLTTDKDEMIGPQGASGAAISPDGRHVITVGTDVTSQVKDTDPVVVSGYAYVFETATGKRVREFHGSAKPDGIAAYSPTGRVVATNLLSGNVGLWNPETGQLARELMGHKAEVGCFVFSSDGQLILTGSHDATAILWEVATGRPIHTFAGHGKPVVSVDVSADRRFVLTGCNDGVTRIWDLATGELLLSIISFLTPQGEHDWIALTPEGLFDGSPVGRERVSYRAGGPYTVVPADRFFQDFYRSGLIAMILGGGGGEAAPVAIAPPPAAVFETTKPPKLKIISPAEGFIPDSDSVTVEVEAADEGGGITGPSLRHNGARVLAAGEAQREGKTVRQTFNVRLVEGENRIRIEAASSDGSWESEPAKFSIPFAKSLPKPRLYVLAVGVNEYQETSFNLRYAVRDAEAIVQLFRERSKVLYESIRVDALVNDKATKKNIRDTLREIASEARPQDTLLVFLSGHGFTVGQRYYFLPHDFKLESEQFEADVRKRGLPGDELADAIGAIPALKRMLILDTCNSGAAIGKSGGQARNPFAFRGAVERLSRAQGIFTIAAASASEDTVEIPKLKHGVLTYSLLAALKGVDDGPLTEKAVKPTNAEQVVGVLEWFSFASGEVPRLTREFLGREQDVKMSGEGTSFPVLPLDRP